MILLICFGLNYVVRELDVDRTTAHTILWLANYWDWAKCWHVFGKFYRKKHQLKKFDAMKKYQSRTQTPQCIWLLYNHYLCGWQIKFENKFIHLWTMTIFIDFILPSGWTHFFLSLTLSCSSHEKYKQIKTTKH